LVSSRSPGSNLFDTEQELKAIKALNP